MRKIYESEKKVRKIKKVREKWEIFIKVRRKRENLKKCLEKLDRFIKVKRKWEKLKQWERFIKLEES